MQFSTPIPIAESARKIGYGSQVVSLGSCFAVNMADKFDYFQFRHTVNPFGILFHPMAIEKLIGFAEMHKTFSDSDVFFHNERWHCFDAHSDLSHPDKETLLQKLNQAIGETHRQIQSATHLIITYGTAWVYREKTSGAVVANCHKVPQANFTKELLSVETIRESMIKTIQSIRRLNPEAQIIFTVSPVRHLKDGFVGNQRSKSHLIAALHGVLETQSGADYFPSYEIVMDELRDYRFYAEDLIHPNTMAVDYIWERFATTQLSSEAHPIMEQVGSLRRSLVHRPFNPNSESHQLFLNKLQQSISALQKQFPHMRF
ncbi:GSCFA domain-containing protein [Flavobacterium sp.]|uniref:GSCFA domain-containing protein n=1 Tax=Flavobacterium sp. TaxID=239 RepID=UPI0039E628FE